MVCRQRLRGMYQSPALSAPSGLLGTVGLAKLRIPVKSVFQSVFRRCPTRCPLV